MSVFWPNYKEKLIVLYTNWDFRVFEFPLLGLGIEEDYMIYSSLFRYYILCHLNISEETPLPGVVRFTCCIGSVNNTFLAEKHHRS